MKKFARKDSLTGKGINDGFCFGDGDFYCASSLYALAKCEELGYKTMEEAYEEEAYYWTEWEIEEGENWYNEDGTEHTDCYNCGETTAVLEEFTFCTQCLTHL